MKKLLIGIGVVIVIIIAAAIIVPLVVPVDVYEGKLIALVKQSTGRDLTIGGPLKLSLLPRLALEADGVAFANAPGGQAPQMAQLKQLQVQVQLLPLLHGAVVIDRFILVDPVIALEVDKSGRANWVFGTTAPAPAATAAPVPASSGAGASPGLSGLRLDDVELTDGKISYFDARTGKTVAVDGINMKLSLPDLDQPFAANGSAVWNGEKVTLAVNVDNPNALLGGRQAQVGIKLASTPISLSFAGPVIGMPPSKANGEVDLETKSLRDLATWLGTPIAVSGSGLGPLSIKGTVAMAGTTYSFSNADIALDAIKAKGGLSIDTAGARPTLKGQLDVDKLDVNPYLPPESSGSSGGSGSGPAGAASPAAKGSGWSDAPIDVSPLKIANVDFDLTAGQILYRKFALGQSALGIHLKDGQLTANLSQMALYQGTGHGTVTVDGSGAVPAISLNFALAQVQIEPLAEAAAGSDRVSGAGTLDIAVTGRGKSQREIIGALNGKGAVNLANGQIKGVNLLALAQNATKSLTGGTSSGNTTDFGTLTGTYTITNGVLHNTDLQIKSGAVPMTGNGTVDLPAQTIDYHVTPQLPGGIGVPIAVTGPWSNISYRPDLGAMLQGAEKEPSKLLDTLKSGGGSAGQGAGSLLKGLLGK